MDRERDKVEKVDRAFVINHKTESTFGSEEKSVENELLQREDKMEDAMQRNNTNLCQ